MKNKDHTKGLLIILIILLIFCTLLYISQENQKAESSDTIATREGQNRIILSWWGNDERHKYTMEGVDHFMEENPEIQVNCRYGEWNGFEKRMEVWTNSHNEADVMQINYAWLDTYSKDGTGYYDLNQLSEYINLDAFSDKCKEYGTRNGHLNALPIAMNSQVFYYNQDILDQYGLSCPENWDDLFEIAEVVSKDGKYLLGMSKKQVFMLLIAYYEQSTGKAMFNDDGKLAASKEEIADILVFYKKLIDEHVLCPVDIFDNAMYQNGQVVGIMCWISDTQKYRDALEEKGVKVSLCLYPMMEGAKRSGWYIKPATMWAISADTKSPKDAAVLLEYLLNDPYMVSLAGTEKGVPVSSKAVEVLSENGLSETNEYIATEEINKRADEINIIIPNIEKEAIIEAFKQNADEYLYDRMDADECAGLIYDSIMAVD